MLKFIQSNFVGIVINIQRLIDHAYRAIVGLPQLKRSQITGELFLGGQYGIRAATTMKKLGITGIINMRMSNLYEEEIKKSFSVLNLNTLDTKAPTLEKLLNGITFIKKELEDGGKVYIHCAYGEGRGPTMAIAYLMSIGMKYENAFNHVKKIRTFIDPTPSQIERLMELEKVLDNKKK